MIAAIAGLIRAEGELVGPGNDHPQRLEQLLRMLLTAADRLDRFRLPRRGSRRPAAACEWPPCATGLR